MSQTSIREATQSDLPTLRSMEQELIAIERAFDAELKPGHTTYYDLEHLIADRDSHLVVAEASDQIVGSGYGQIRESKSCFVTEQHCYMGFIFVCDSHRGLGLAQQIMETIRDWSETRGVTHCLLDVYAANKAAIRAYEKLGFVGRSVMMELRR